MKDEIRKSDQKNKLAGKLRQNAQIRKDKNKLRMQKLL